MDPFWFESYLRNRTQSVQLNDTVSDKTSISYGVPQGSVLGPILSSICVNDRALFLPNCDVIQYADDTQIILSSNIDNWKDLIQKPEDTLKLAKIYSNANGLMLNDKKNNVFILEPEGFYHWFLPTPTWWWTAMLSLLVHQWRT